MSTFGSKVYKGSSGYRSFAQSSEDRTDSQGSVIDTSDVLAAIKSDTVHTEHDLANAMNVTQATISPLVTELTDKGFVDASGGSLSLSESGERALTYSRMAKF